MEKIPSLDDDRLMTRRIRKFIEEHCLEDTDYAVTGIRLSGTTTDCPLAP